MSRWFLITVFTLCALMPAMAQQQAVVPAFDPPLGEGAVFTVEVEGMIDTGLARYLSRAFSEAERADASVIILHIDTFGGLVDAADDINKLLLQSPVPTVAFIDRNAASAGALIAYAANRIVMAPGSAIGAATAVDQTGEYASEKIQSYMRGLMRATAETRGRDPNIAQAMVDERIVIEGVVTAEQLLSLTTEEAKRLGVADASAANMTELIADLGLQDRELVTHRTSGTERVLRFLGSPIMASLLMMMMMGGLYFELQTPGVGFAGSIAVIGAALFFAPHYALGMVESWEIILFVIGITLLLIEVFVTPGFGVAGIGGALLILGALMASLIPNVGVIWPSTADITRAALTMSASIVLMVVLASTMGRYLPKSNRFNMLVLQPVLSSATGYSSAATDDALMGRTGIAVSTLRPSGTVEIDGRRIDVVAPGLFVTSGTPIEVTRVRGGLVEVRPVRGAEA